MSIGGKLILLGASVAVVVLIVVYGGAPAPVSAGAGVTEPASVAFAGASSTSAAARAKPTSNSSRALSTPAQPATSRTRVVSTSPLPSTASSTKVINEHSPTAETIVMGQSPSADLLRRYTSGLARARANASKSLVTAPSRPRVSSPPKPPSEVTVAAGDTLTAIAARMLGDGDDWYLIKAANPGIDPERLMVGQVLKLPAKNGTTPTPQPKPVAARSHRVGEGDTLTSIASDYYGDSQRWGDIFEANRAALGGNPNRLRVDVVLVIP